MCVEALDGKYKLKFAQQIMLFFFIVKSLMKLWWQIRPSESVFDLKYDTFFYITDVLQNYCMHFEDPVFSSGQNK